MPALRHPAIALDGTAASGKSTFARALARRLGFAYVNTGAMYRGVTWHLIDRGVALQDRDAITRAIRDVRLETRLEFGELFFFIDGIDPLPHVRQARVNEGVSLVAQVPEVRRRLVLEQQAVAAQAPVVMEGRDIGTVVLPDTPYKFFLDADAEIRAERRTRQGEVDLILDRDRLDTHREASPLLCAPDALRLDSGSATVDELVERALEHLAHRGLTATAA